MQLKIKLSSLPTEIQNQLPLSIRMIDEHQLDQLPMDVQYLISKYLDETVANEPDYSTFYDAIPALSAYDDFQLLANKKTLISEYLKNYFLISLTSYPFDVKFGSRLQQYLQTKDVSLQHTLISNEINNIIGVIASDYNININVVSVNINPIQSGTTQHDYTYVKIKLELEINEESTVLEVEM